VLLVFLYIIIESGRNEKMLVTILYIMATAAMFMIVYIAGSWQHQTDVYIACLL